jgi:hypothetical protein
MDSTRFNITRDGATYNITSAQRVGGTRKPRTRTVALTDCVCYDADGNVTRVISRTASNRTRKPNRRPTVAAQVTSDITLMSRMGSIHEGAA